MQTTTRELENQLGQILVSVRIDEKMKSNTQFKTFIYTCLGRYVRCDWGATDEEDAKANDEAVKNGERILAVYERGATDDVIWIITEADRSATTILYPEEY